ncbi:hypothetical protein RQCS_20990 [Rhodococcus qingshengii]|nr:hypothetical protein RQCS_20990 [Rhodococcus qingshengii]
MPGRSVEPRWQGHGAPGRHGSHGPLVGNGDNNLGAAAYGTVNGFDEAWITGIVTGDDDHIQRPGPRRRPVENEERATDRISDESKRDPGSVPGATRAGDEYDAARTQTGQSGDHTLTDGRRGGPNLCAAHGYRPQ